MMLEYVFRYRIEKLILLACLYDSDCCFMYVNRMYVCQVMCFQACLPCNIDAVDCEVIVIVHSD